MEVIMSSNQNETADNINRRFWTWVNIKYLSKWAFAGFIGTIIGLVGAGILLEIIIDGIANSGGRHGGASLIIFVAVFAAIFGYPLIGAFVGVVMGIRKLKHDIPKGNINENNYGLRAGIIVGLFFYVLMFSISMIDAISSALKHH
jgi:hypothetical protein